MRLYLKLIAVDLKSQMQYKLSFFLTTFGQFVTAFTAFFGLHFIFERVSAVDGFAYGQVLLCFSVIMMSFAIGEMIGAGLQIFSRLLGNGAFDRALVRPRSALLQVLAPHVDFSRLGLLIQAAVVLAIAVPVSGVSWSLDKAIVLGLMVLCGAAVFFALFLLKAACAFFTVESLDFMNLFTYGARQFGRYPFSAYGNGVLKFLTFVIPLALFQYYPLLYLIDRENSVLYMLMPLASLLFLLPAYALFRFGMKRYKSTGS